MAESESHKRTKREAAGKSGKNEVQLAGGKRLDAATKTTATEVERSGRAASLRAAARRLDASGKPRRVLQVPQKDMGKAKDALKAEGVTGTVRNMGGTRTSQVRRGRASSSRTGKPRPRRG